MIRIYLTIRKKELQSRTVRRALPGGRPAFHEEPIMFDVKRWLSSFFVLAITALPVMAGNNDAKTAKENAAGASSAEAGPAANNGNPSPVPTPSPSLSVTPPTAVDANITALLGVLVMKGVLNPSEANAIRNAAPTTQFQALVEALSRKGVLSAGDLAPAANPAPQHAAVAAAPQPDSEAGSSSSSSSTLTVAESSPQQQTQPGPGQPVPSRVAGELPHIPPSVITAVTPVRVFPVDAPKTGGLAGIKAGPITLAPYGFVKATVIHDSSDPDGDDFPFPGIWLNSGTNSTFNTGPTADPEVHVKARSTRFGLNIEWPDVYFGIRG